MAKENNGQKSNQPEFAIQRLFVKDVSFEAPHTPELFLSKWEPKVDIDLKTESTKIEDNLYDVFVTVSATTKLEEKVAFVVEVTQAGLFTVSGFEGDDKARMLGSFCPNILFPYARQVCSDLVSQGGFPPLYLAPVNFDALYEQQKANAEKKQ